MTVSILRTADAWWVQTPSGAARIRTEGVSTAEVLADRAAIDAAAHSTDTVPVENLTLVSPVTTPCRLVAQATNYASHVRDVGRDPAKTPLTFFRKASGSVTGPFDDIVKPPHVQLLDYELEIGLLIGRPLPVGTEVTEANLADFVHGLLVTNDVSARDVQLTKAQFYESKSYPTFTPVGPALVLVDADELKRFGDLRLQLRVNGEVRQRHGRRGRHALLAGRGPADAGKVPEARRRRRRSHRYPGRHRAHRAWNREPTSNGSDDIPCRTGKEPQLPPSR